MHAQGSDQRKRNDEACVLTNHSLGNLLNVGHANGDGLDFIAAFDRIHSAHTR